MCPLIQSRSVFFGFSLKKGMIPNALRYTFSNKELEINGIRNILTSRPVLPYVLRDWQESAQSICGEKSVCPTSLFLQDEMA